MNSCCQYSVVVLAVALPHPPAMSSVSLSTYHNTFPRVVYPTETYTEVYAGRQYILADAFSTEKDLSSTFNLGVYNLSKIDDSLIPIDPLCLVTLLSILKKENANFPSSKDEVTYTLNPCTKSTISILSYHAAIDDQLPILIEDHKDKSNKSIVRNIHHSKTINVLNTSKLSNTDKLIFNSINEKLFDFYTLSVLNLSDSEILQYYSLFNYTFPSNLILPISKVMGSKTRVHLLKRNDFHIRNPNIYSYFANTIVTKSNRLAYEQESIKICQNAKELLNDLNSIFESQLFWNEDSETAEILDFQLASYVYCINHMSTNIPLFKNVILEYPNLLTHSNRIISPFV